MSCSDWDPTDSDSNWYNLDEEVSDQLDDLGSSTQGFYDDLTGHTYREDLKRQEEKVAADALTEEQRIEADKARINTLFGVGDAPSEPFDVSRPRPLQEWEQNRDTRKATLDSIYGDILGNYTNELDEQFTTKSADVKAMLAGRGISRSSVGQSILDNLGHIYDKQEATFEQGAGDTVRNIESADEQARFELTELIDAGGDYGNAAKNALKRQEHNVDTSVENARARDLTNLFKDMDRLYGQKQYVDGYNTGQERGSTNLFTPGGSGGTSSSSGTLVNY